jgi:hypothetical protein
MDGRRRTWAARGAHSITGGCPIASLGIAVVLVLGLVSPAPAQLVCQADPSRTTFTGGGSDNGGCRQFNDNQTACERAFNLGESGIVSCFFTPEGNPGEGACRGCGPENQNDELCTNTCAPPPRCANDPSRTIFTGGASDNSGCHDFDGDQASCEKAFNVGFSGIVSCFYDSGNCKGCGPDNFNGGLCTNTCAPPPACAGDPSRIVFAGYPETQACSQFEGDPTTCEQAFHRAPNDLDASCFVAQECELCEPPGCTAKCVPPPSCDDVTRTIYAGGPNSDACRQYGDDQVTCEKAYHLGKAGVATCFFDGSQCLGCGPSNEGSQCTNTCVPPPPCADASRTNFVGGPDNGACRQLSTEGECIAAYHRGLSGIASCYWTGSECAGCGSGNESGGACTNTCRPAPSCADGTRAVFAGGPFSGACQQYLTEDDCEIAYHQGLAGNASCYWNGSQCFGCGPENEGNGECINTCDPPAPCDDASRTRFAGRPLSNGCQQFGGDQTSCEQAYVIGDAGPTSCFFANGSCNGCGPRNLSNGDCANTCQPLPVCTLEPSRTTLSDCSDLDNDPATCAQAFEYVVGGHPIPCTVVDKCRGCGLENQAEGLCANTCFAASVQAAPVPTLSWLGIGIVLAILTTLGLRQIARH